MSWVNSRMTGHTCASFSKSATVVMPCPMLFTGETKSVFATVEQSKPLAKFQRETPFFPSQYFSNFESVFAKSPIVLIAYLSKIFFVARPTPSNSEAGSAHIFSRKVSFSITVTASGFFISEPSFANILLKETPTEIVKPNSNLIVSRMVFATFSGAPKILSVPLISNQHSSIPYGSTWSV